MATSSVVRKSHRFAPDLPCAALAEQVGPGVTINFIAGRTIVIEGDPIEYVYRILSGTVRLYKAVADGRRQIIDFLGPTDCFGLTGLEQHPCSVETITEVVMVRYPRQRLEAAVEERPDLGRQLLRLACEELGRAQQRMLLLGRKNADERVATFLLDLAERQDVSEEGDDCVHLAMSRQDIADHLGLTIETVSRIFSRFRLAGLIDLPDRSAATLRDVAGLSRIADGDTAA